MYSNEEFSERIKRQTEDDCTAIAHKLGRPLNANETARIGVSQLRSFMEEVLKRLYREYLPGIIELIAHKQKQLVRLPMPRLRTHAACMFLQLWVVAACGVIASPQQII